MRKHWYIHTYWQKAALWFWFRSMSQLEILSSRLSWSQLQSINLQVINGSDKILTHRNYTTLMSTVLTGLPSLCSLKEISIDEVSIEPLPGLIIWWFDCAFIFCLRMFYSLLINEKICNNHLQITAFSNLLN